MLSSGYLATRNFHLCFEIGLAESMQETGLLGHVERSAGELVVLGALEIEMRLHRVGFAWFASAARRATKRKMRILDDAIVAEIFFAILA